MEYTVQKLGALAGVSTRTLRYYDEIGLLKPARINSSGYRIYGEKEVNALQQILFYRELGVSLEEIKEIVSSPDFDSVAALKEHREKLLEKQRQLDQLIKNVNATILSAEGRMTMSDQEKFEGFKKKLVDDNEKKYGAEIREKYGDAAIDESNRKLMNMSEKDYEQLQALEQKMFTLLAEAIETGDPSSEIAQQAADLHKKWLCFYWKEYNKDAHANLAQMYVDDERFTAYYDKQKKGTAVFLRDAILTYTAKQQ
ncbi:MerR family transcriptional regulator [Cytobacillus gottheilii]|uniref:MerR family transcriptional regulator n=1 Tax=Cytobacillus gottheilii TaxID=859144 RepID=UPI00249555BE|nr:MerR family transcriptional regulator [Cytobacillus gottheilii]